MTTVIAGVYKQSGLPDEIIPVKVAADGTLAGGGEGGGSGTSDISEQPANEALDGLGLKLINN